MTQEEREKFNRTPITVVITRSCRAKVDDDTKPQDFKVGDKVDIVGKYAAELISMQKAVKEGSPEHKKWAADEEKKAATKKALAPSQVSTSEAILKLAAEISEQNKLIGQLLADGKKK